MLSLILEVANNRELLDIKLNSQSVNNFVRINSWYINIINILGVIKVNFKV